MNCSFTYSVHVMLGFKGEDYGKGRWTQTQLLTGGRDIGKNKSKLYLKLNTKTKRARYKRQTRDKRQSSNEKQPDKVATKNSKTK